MDLREDVLKALETARNEKIIGKSLNAHLILYPKGKITELLSKIEVNLAQVFIVSKLEIKYESYGQFKGNDVSIDVLACEGTTCNRCWQVVDHVHEDGLCERCFKIIQS
jgi:isoleucyl-tRNA synthetase